MQLINDTIQALLHKRIARKQAEIIKLRWQKAELERKLKNLQREKALRDN